MKNLWRNCRRTSWNKIFKMILVKITKMEMNQIFMYSTIMMEVKSNDNKDEWFTVIKLKKKKRKRV